MPETGDKGLESIEAKRIKPGPYYVPKPKVEDGPKEMPLL